MKKYKKYIAGIVIFVIAVVLITLLDFNPFLVTTQDVGSEKCYSITGISSGSVATQEITMMKDYINGIGLLFTINSRINDNDNVILILDSNYKVLYRKTFSSLDVKDYQYYPLNFHKSIKIGKGKKIYLCHYSNNGTENNHVSVYCKPYSTLGKLYVSAIPDNDVIKAAQNKTKPYVGSFILKTYESNYNTSFLLKLIFYLLAAGLSLIIIYFRFLFNYISRLRLKPEMIFAVLSAVFGILFVFLTPPMQVPDEQSHFNRAYQISELNIFKTYQTLPKSILHLDTVYQRMKFYSSEKTSFSELKATAKMKLEPGTRLDKGTNDYFIPYIPAAVGIFLGRIVNCNPIILLFLGRIFNLFFGIFMIYLAIKIMPVYKWIFFLVGLLPMALFMRASVSYDVVKTGLSFLLIALCLQFAYDDKKTIARKDLVYLFIIITCLALSKVPYFIPGLLFLLIPVKKIGSLKKYILIFLSLMIIPAIAIKLSSLGMALFAPHTELLGERAYGMPSWMSPENPNNQIHFMLGNIVTYIGILLKTIFVYKGNDYLVSFIGNLGWVDTPMPLFLVILWYIILFLTAIGSPVKEINPGWKLRIIPLVCFIGAVVLIESVNYVVVTPYKSISVEGVQGRYFIPYVPLLLIIFYNVYISEKLNIAFSFRKNELRKAKAKEQPRVILEIQKNEQVFTKTYHLFLVFFVVFTLFMTSYILAHRYYFIGESSASVESRINAENRTKMKIQMMQENQQAEARFVNLANNAAKANKLDSVTFYLEKVVDLDPTHVQAAQNLAMLYFQLKKKDKALKVIEKMRANGMEISKELLNLAKQ